MKKHEVSLILAVPAVVYLVIGLLNEGHVRWMFFSACASVAGAAIGFLTYKQKQ